MWLVDHTASWEAELADDARGQQSIKGWWGRRACMAEKGISQSTAGAHGYCGSVCLRESQIFDDDKRGTKGRKWGGKKVWGGGRKAKREEEVKWIELLRSEGRRKVRRL
jgi:hypothetical protein